MHGALDITLFQVKKLVVHPVQWRTGMRAAVQVGVQVAIATDNKTLDQLLLPGD